MENITSMTKAGKFQDAIIEPVFAQQDKGRHVFLNSTFKKGLSLI